jgi:hypothetical protein
MYLVNYLVNVHLGQCSPVELLPPGFELETITEYWFGWLLYLRTLLGLARYLFRLHWTNFAGSRCPLVFDNTKKHKVQNGWLKAIGT